METDNLAEQPQFGGRDVATILSAEQPISVLGDAVIKPVAQRPRQDEQRLRSAQRPAERGHDGDETVELREGRAIDDGEVGVVVLGWQAVLAKQQLAERRLRRGEAEAFFPVESEDELDEA